MMSAGKEDAAAVRVLLIENDQDKTDLPRLEEEVGHRAFSLHTCISLSDGLIAAEAGQFAVILLDLSLPGSGGVTTFTQLHTAAPHTPIVVLTSPEQQALAKNCMELGAQGYLLKNQAGSLLAGTLGQQQWTALHRPNSETFLNTLINAIPLPIFYKDKEGRYLGCNQAFESFFGKTGDQLIGKNVFDINPPELAEIYHAKDQELFQSGDVQQYEAPVKNSSGALREVIFHKAVFTDEGGNVGGLIGLVLEISEHKRTATALAKQERILDATGRMARIGGWEHDLTTGKATWTNSLFEIIGLPITEEPPGPGEHLSFYPPRDREMLEQAYTKAVNQGTPFDLELQGYTATRRLRWWRAQGEPVVQGGRCVAMRGAFQDITERKEMELQLAQSERLTSMGLLAAGVAHEINNPLCYVLHNLESLTTELPQILDTTYRLQARLAQEMGADLQKELTDEAAWQLTPTLLHDIRHRLEDALEGTRRIHKISNGLSTFSRVEKDQLTPVNLVPVIEAALNMAFNEIKYRARLVEDYREIPLVLAREGQLSQVFLSLILNAVQAIDEGHPEENEIRVRTWAAEGEVFAEVRDTGSGITPEHLDRIFEPFFTTKQIGEGSGLGLAIVKNIVESYKGSISIHSEVGHGSRCTIRLPRWDETNIPVASSSVEDKEPRPQARILIVDDEQPIRAILVRILREYDTMEAASGSAAQRILEEDQDFDLVVCDMMMPDVSGMDLHRWLRDENPRLAKKLIFITGGAFTPRAREYLSMVDNLQIEKPFNVANFKKAVLELLHTPS